ncbi:MAG: hypothetical protein AB1414_20670, partial [bacterium]
NKVLRYDKTNGAVTTLLTRNEEITSLAVDENHLWIGTNDKLISCNKDGGAIEEYFQGMKITSLCRDNNWIWIATNGNGLIEYDERTEKFQIYTTENSNMLSNNITTLSAKDRDVWMITDKGVCGYRAKLVEESISNNLDIASNEKKSMVINIGTPTISGKYYIHAKLLLSSGQFIGFDSDSFYVSKATVTLTFNLDKPVYKPDELITITGKVYNKDLVLPAYNLNLYINADDKTILSETINIGTNSVYEFIATTTATKSFTIVAGVDEIRLEEYVVIIEEPLKIDITEIGTPNRGTNTFTIKLNNTGDAETVINGRWKIGDEEWQELGTVTILPGGIKEIALNYQFPPDNYQSGYATITLVLSGDITGTYTRQIEFGEKVDVKVEPEIVYPLGYVEVPFTITNQGKQDSEFELTFLLNKQEQEQNIKVFAFPTPKEPSWLLSEPKIVIKSNTVKNPHPVKTPPKAPQTDYSEDIIRISSEFYIPNGGTITGSLIYEL